MQATVRVAEVLSQGEKCEDNRTMYSCTMSLLNLPSSTHVNPQCED